NNIKLLGQWKKVERYPGDYIRPHPPADMVSRCGSETKPHYINQSRKKGRLHYGSRRSRSGSITKHRYHSRHTGYSQTPIRRAAAVRCHCIWRTSIKYPYPYYTKTTVNL